MDGQQNNQSGWNRNEAPRTYGEDTKMYQNRHISSRITETVRTRISSRITEMVRTHISSRITETVRTHISSRITETARTRISSRIMETGREIPTRRSSTVRYPMFCAIFFW